MAKKKVDFTGVETYQRASEGQHVAKIIEAKEAVSQGGGDMIKVVYEIAKGPDKGCRVYENYPLQENSLWKLKGLLQSIGVKADGKVMLDISKMVGKSCIIEVFHEEYNGTLRGKINETRKLESKPTQEAAADEEDFEDEEEDEEDEEEEVPAPKKKAAKKEEKKPTKKKPVVVEEDDEEDEDSDDEDDDDDEEEVPVTKKKTKKPEVKAKKEEKKPAKKAPVVEDDEEDWDDEEDDEE